MYRNIIGRKFARLTIVSKVGYNKNGHCIVLVRCDCGIEKNVHLYRLIQGDTKSCGCLNSEKARQRALVHGMADSPLYNLWQHMKRRCYKPSNKSYKDYGGRGIAVCAEWYDNFQAFYSWAITNGYQKGLQIDRKDNDGNYCPDNCRFVTQKVNANNRRSNVFISYNGETHTIAEWAEKLNLKYGTLSNRVNRGWPLEKALTA